MKKIDMTSDSQIYAVLKACGVMSVISQRLHNKTKIVPLPKVSLVNYFHILLPEIYFRPMLARNVHRSNATRKSKLRISLATVASNHKRYAPDVRFFDAVQYIYSPPRYTAGDAATSPVYSTVLVSAEPSKPPALGSPVTASDMAEFLKDSLTMSRCTRAWLSWSACTDFSWAF